MAHAPHMRGHKGHHHRRSYGGRTDKKATHEYNAVGSPAMKAAEEEKDDGFKRGGHKKRKHGGHVDGKKAAHRLDKRRHGGKLEHHAHGGHHGGHESHEEKAEHHKRGGHVGHHHAHGAAVHHGHGMKRYAKGGSPMSSAAHTHGPDGGGKAGHESERAPEEP